MLATTVYLDIWLRTATLLKHDSTQDLIQIAMQEENDVPRARESKSTNGKDATSMEMIKPPRETIHYYDFLSY